MNGITIDICNHCDYNDVVIKDFCDKRTEDIFHDRHIRRLDKRLKNRARRRLELLNAAVKLEDMYFPPSNRFHTLQGFQPPRYSIWINNQWRITFEWEEGDAYDVCFEDYHA